MRVCKFDKRLVCGGKVSNLLFERSRNNKSVKLIKSDGGICSILKNEKKKCQQINRIAAAIGTYWL